MLGNEMSDAVKAFVEANRPPQRYLTEIEVRQGAAIAGLTVFFDRKFHPEFSGRDSFYCALLTKWGPETESYGRGRFTKPAPLWRGTVFERTLEVNWYPHVEGGRVVFKPLLSGGSSSNRGKSPDDSFLSALGILPVAALSAEPVIVMPTPSWSWGYAEEGWPSYAQTTAMFVSEAKEAVRELNGKLSELGLID